MRARGGLGAGMRPGGREGAEVLARPPGPFVIGASATGGHALGGGDEVAGGAVVIRVFRSDHAARIPDLGRAGAEAVIRVVDADGQAASAVTDGGRGGADGARSICYSGHGKRAPVKLADQAPRVLLTLAGPLFFRAGQSGPVPVIVP